MSAFDKYDRSVRLATLYDETENNRQGYFLSELARFARINFPQYRNDLNPQWNVINVIETMTRVITEKETIDLNGYKSCLVCLLAILTPDFYRSRFIPFAGLRAPEPTTYEVLRTLMQALIDRDQGYDLEIETANAAQLLSLIHI